WWSRWRPPVRPTRPGLQRPPRQGRSGGGSWLGSFGRGGNGHVRGRWVRAADQLGTDGLKVDDLVPRGDEQTAGEESEVAAAHVAVEGHDAVALVKGVAVHHLALIVDD